MNNGGISCSASSHAVLYLAFRRRLAAILAFHCAGILYEPSVYLAAAESIWQADCIGKGRLSWVVNVVPRPRAHEADSNLVQLEIG